MGLFSKKLDYTSGAGYFPKVAASDYIRLETPNRSVVYGFNIPLAQAEQRYNKAEYVLDELMRMANDSQTREQLDRKAAPYLHAFAEKTGINDVDMVHFEFVFILGAVFGILEERSGLAVKGMMHPSIGLYMFQLESGFTEKFRSDLSHIRPIRQI